LSGHGYLPKTVKNHPNLSKIPKHHFLKSNDRVSGNGRFKYAASSSPPAANPIARIKQHLVTAKVFQSDWDAS
jgi:hypothetical protein